MEEYKCVNIAPWRKETLLKHELRTVNGEKEAGSRIDHFINIVLC